MNLCQLCGRPAFAATCPDCIEKVNALLTDAVFLLPQLTLEAGKQTSKTPGGYTTGSEGRPLGVNLGAISISRRLSAAVGDLGARCGVATTDPAIAREHTYKLAHTQEGDPAKELVGDLTNAVRSATNLIDLAPQIKTHGRCPTCQTWIKAPADREVHFCTACGTELDLARVRVTLRDIVLDALGGCWLTPPDMVWAIKLCDKKVTPKDVENWAARDKLPAGHRAPRGRGSARAYLFDDVLDAVEQRDLKRARVEEKKKKKHARKVLDREGFLRETI